MKTLVKLAVLICLLVISSGINAQINLGKKVLDKTKDRAVQKTDQGIDKGLDAVEDEIEGTDQQDKEKTEEAGKKETEQMPGKTTEAVKTDTVKQQQTTLQSYSKYDFVPGDTILFYEDFSQDAIGDFPALWTTNGGGEVKTVNIAEGNWFHMNVKDAIYCCLTEINFPANFILEFDIIPDAVYYHGIIMTLYGGAKLKELDAVAWPGDFGVHITLRPNRWETVGYTNVGTDREQFKGNGETATVEKEKVNHVIIWIQNRRIRIYSRGLKVLDMPTNLHTGTTFKRIRFSGYDRNSYPYITNLKVTTAASDTRSKLLTEGKLVTYGIYFDVNKDVVKSESFGALNDIAKILKENPDVRIRIIGHTDSDGIDAANLDLSKRRAESVKNELSKGFGINASRMETDGKGETEPIAPNDTPSNKALNRRVELVKL